MKPLRNLKKIIFILLLFLYSVQLAQAGEQITLSPGGSHSNQNQINEALKKGNVYLGPGVYEITGPIYVQRNTIFSGDANAKILVSSDISSPWFSPTVGVVNVLDPYNIQITGFEIDGNCQNLNPDWANSPGHAHDQEQLIKIAGSSSNFGNNILIANMKLHNSFGDGIQARFIDGIICSDNTIINTQHECIYFKLCKNCKMLKNQMAVITSGGSRFDNCYNGEAEGNIVWKYDGANNNGAYKGGANGFQVGDAGSSKGYDARTNLIHTENIEIHNNTIIDPGRESIVVDAAGQRPSTNVYLHNNIFVDTEEVKRMGISVSDDISVNNPPSIEMSEKVFSSIFDILGVEFTNTGRTNQTSEEIPYTIQETERGRIAGGIKIIGFKDLINIDGVPYIPNNDSILVKYEAMKAPSFSWYNTGVSKIKKDVDIKNENGNVTATLTVTMEWYKLSTDSTGTTKKKYRTSEAIFSDTVEAPQVLNRPFELRGILYEYPIHSLAYVPPDGLSQVEYEYDGKKVKHIYLLGERRRNENGVLYTNFSKVNYWKGDLHHQGQFLFIDGPLDPEKMTVTAYTPYETFQVTHFDYVKKDYPEKFYDDWVFPSFGLFVILGFGAWYFIRKILY